MPGCYYHCIKALRTVNSGNMVKTIIAYRFPFHLYNFTFSAHLRSRPCNSPFRPVFHKLRDSRSIRRDMVYLGLGRHFLDKSLNYIVSHSI